MSQTGTVSPTEETLDALRQAGLPIQRQPRAYMSKRMSGFNASVYSQWIERWARNAALNYPVISDSWGIRFLKKSAHGIPACVVGIGPSLDESIVPLAYAHERCLIIATDAAVRPLLRHGIKPDLVVNYDARDDQRTMWDTVDTSDLVLVANSVTSANTIDAWKGKSFFFNMQQLDDEFATNILPSIYPHLGELPNMGTVGNGAIYLAHEMGCAPIFSVGMDLCYRRIGDAWRYRCKDFLQKPNDIEFPDAWIETENKVLYDNDDRMSRTFDIEHKGETFRVDEPLKFYANSLLSNIGTLDLPVINCSGGVLSKYIKSMPLDEALKTKCPKQIYPGQTVVRFVNQIMPDGKAGRTFDGEYWRDHGSH